MGKYPDRLVVSPSKNAVMWRIEKDFSYVTSPSLGRVTIVVQASFMTDFASVPSLLRWVWPKWGLYGWAAVVHDWLYSEQMYCKEFADDVLFDAMKTSGVCKFTMWCFYRAVSCFGRLAWLSAAARKRAGKSKFDLSGTQVPPSTLPNWDMGTRKRYAGMWREWKALQAMNKFRKQ